MDWRVLIVDDEELIREGLKVMIERLELFRGGVRTAANGLEAYDVYREFKPQIILTDIKMPEMDGLELIGRVRGEGDSTTGFIIISGYGDFSYAKTAIKYGVQEYLMKPVDRNEVSESLRKIVNELEKEAARKETALTGSIKSREADIIKNEKAANRLISGEKLLGPEERQFAERLVRECGIGNYRIFIMRVCADGNSRIADHELLKFSVRNIVGEFLAEAGYGFYLFSDGMGRITGIMNPGSEDGADEGTTRQKLHAILEAVEKFLETRLSIGVSTTCRSLVEMPKAYTEALEAMKFNKLTMGDRVTFYQELKQSRAAGKVDPEEKGNSQSFTDNKTIHRVIAMVEQGNYPEAAALLDRMFSGVIEYYSPHVAQIEKRLIDMAAYVVSYFRFERKDLDGILGMEFDVAREFDESDTVEEFKGRVRNIICKIGEHLDQVKANLAGNKGIITYALDYINKNYNNDITLDEVASHVSMNVSYFSTLFKKTKGMNFIEYLTHYRMEKAKELLAHPSLKVYEIAQKIGYASDKHFCKIFKKHTGISPNEYRNNCLMLFQKE